MAVFEELVCAVLGLTPEDLTDDLSRASHHAWDSIRHIELMVTLEGHYGMSFSSRQMASVHTVRELRTLVGEAG